MDPTTLLGTIASLQLAQDDKAKAREQEEEEVREQAKQKARLLADSSYTDFTDWDKIERPRMASLNNFNNNYISALAISGDDYLRYNSKLNPNAPFQGKKS